MWTRATSVEARQLKKTETTWVVVSSFGAAADFVWRARRGCKAVSQAEASSRACPGASGQEGGEQVSGTTAMSPGAIRLWIGGLGVLFDEASAARCNTDSQPNEGRQ